MKINLKPITVKEIIKNYKDSVPKNELWVMEGLVIKQKIKLNL